MSTEGCAIIYNHIPQQGRAAVHQVPGSPEDYPYASHNLHLIRTFETSQITAVGKECGPKTSPSFEWENLCQLGES